MELTQRLECTQELYSNNSEKLFPEQVGFLGICGTKYPLKKGPNKIGRDPETCHIVLNLNSISRQHAVINILNNHDFMLMDLDSANKTKIANKTLQAYIPHPLKNGDMVQFGQVFGVFRLLEEDNDLPMTQAIDIPETPVQIRHVSKLNNVHTTTIPESPDVSDREESFIGASQSKTKEVFKSPSNNFLKTSGKTIAIKPIGTNKIDNVYWKSSKKSDSFSLQSNNSGNLDDSVLSAKLIDTDINQKTIHELDTQVPCSTNHNESSDSIYNANTQIPDKPMSPTIYNMETQVPVIENLPEVCKINEQKNINFNLYAENKENDIFNAETQGFVAEVNKTPTKDIKNYQHSNSSENSKSNLNTSDDLILFDEIDSQPVEDNIESQVLIPHDIVVDNSKSKEDSEKSEQESEEIKIMKQCTKRTNRIESDSSTDCEDIHIALTQKISKQINNDDDVTDCEDCDEIVKESNKIKKPDIDDDLTDCEDDDIVSNKKIQPTINKENKNFEDMATQIIADIPNTEKVQNIEDLATQIIVQDNVLKNKITETKFEDLQTQVIENGPPQDVCFEEALTQQISLEEDITPFKVPVISPLKRKRKDLSKTGTDSNESRINKENNETITIEDDDDDDDKYYAATQDLFNDLCSQREVSPEIGGRTLKKNTTPSTGKSQKTSHIVHKEKISPESLGSECEEEKVSKVIDKMSKSQIMDVVGVAPLKKMASDSSSDVEITPKKPRLLKFLDVDLPNTQEIKKSISLTSKNIVTESSSDTDTEEEAGCTSPIMIPRKRKNSGKAKLDLTSKLHKLDVEKLPSRISTRTRKPTSKIQDSGEVFKDTCKNILKSRFLCDQENEVNKEIIRENILNYKEKQSRSRAQKQNSVINLDDYCGKNQSEEIIIISSEKDANKDTKNENKDTRKNQRKKEMPNKSKTKTENLKYVIEIDDNNEKYKSKEIISPKSKKEEDSKETRRSKRKKEKEKQPINENKQSNEKSIEDITEKLKSQSNSKTAEINNKITEKPESTSKSTRGTRSRNKRKDVAENTKKKSVSPEKETIKKDNQNTDKKSSHKCNKEFDKRELSPDIEVRRSSRTRTAKKSNDVSSDDPKSKAKLSKSNSSNHEQSTVYNMSSESGTASPNMLKRSATSELNFSSAKKTKTVSSTNSTNLRSTPMRKTKTHYVLFTAFPCDEVRIKLEKLGAVIVSDVMQCTMVLTLQIKRTFKLLCAVGLGKPIVGPNWVQACVDTNMIVDPWLYLMKDEQTEKRFHFNLERTLVGKRNFLKGYNISSTPNVMPSAPEMKLIVECSGGKWSNDGPNWVCVSAPADKSMWPALKKKGATIVSTEFILGGVLKQKIDMGKNKLA